jgi:hypothetical protein
MVLNFVADKNAYIFRLVAEGNIRRVAEQSLRILIAAASIDQLPNRAVRETSSFGWYFHLLWQLSWTTTTVEHETHLLIARALCANCASIINQAARLFPCDQKTDPGIKRRPKLDIEVDIHYKELEQHKKRAALRGLLDSTETEECYNQYTSRDVLMPE